MPRTVQTAQAGDCLMLQKRGDGTWHYALFEFASGVFTLAQDQSVAIETPQNIEGALRLSDGSYTLGIGGATVGMLMVQNGAITIQEASP